MTSKGRFKAAPVGAATADPSALSIVHRCSGSHLVLSATGMLTSDSIAALEALIDQIGCAESSHVTLDLSRLIGIDETGVNVVLGLVHYVRALGRRIEVSGAHGQVAAALADTPLFEPPVG
jgi:anti-anti-sigma regulatory factor